MLSSPTENYPETGTRTHITASASRRRVKARISKGRTCPRREHGVGEGAGPKPGGEELFSGGAGRGAVVYYKSVELGVCSILSGTQ